MRHIKKSKQYDVDIATMKSCRPPHQHFLRSKVAAVRKNAAEHLITVPICMREGAIKMYMDNCYNLGMQLLPLDRAELGFAIWAMYNQHGLQVNEGELARTLGVSINEIFCHHWLD